MYASSAYLNCGVPRAWFLDLSCLLYTQSLLIHCYRIITYTTISVRITVKFLFNFIMKRRYRSWWFDEIDLYYFWYTLYYRYFARTVLFLTDVENKTTNYGHVKTSYGESSYLSVFCSICCHAIWICLNSQDFNIIFIISVGTPPQIQLRECSAFLSKHLKCPAVEALVPPPYPEHSLRQWLYLNQV